MDDLFAERGRPDTDGPDRIWSVSELVGGVRELLEEELGRVRVLGEVSDLFRARSGHTYFTLKDDGARIKAALFAGSAARIPFDPEDGLEIVVHGEVTVYTQRGEMQIIVRGLEPVGQGALQLAFEQLRERLAAEGLFDEDRKRALPEFPRRIGLVTSPDGAAIHDVIQVSGARFPGTPLLLAPTRVQGDGADREIAAALERVSRAPEVDVILLVRGGGSLEDLQSFNSELLARAIRACAVPVVCGVGHETDFTIADFAADLRAPTPSAAVALALPDREVCAEQVEQLHEHLRGALSVRLSHARAALRATLAELRSRAPAARLAADRERFVAARHLLTRSLAGAVGSRRQPLARLDLRWRRAAANFAAAPRIRRKALEERLLRAGRGSIEPAAGRLAEAAARLDALSPLGVLARGFAIARTVDGSVLRSADAVEPGDAIRVGLARGELRARVDEVSMPDPVPTDDGPPPGRGD